MNGGAANALAQCVAKARSETMILAVKRKRGLVSVSAKTPFC